MGRRHPARQFVSRQKVLPEDKIKVTPFSNKPCICNGLGHVPERLFHLVRRPEIEFISRKLEPFLVFNCLACLNTEQDVMGLCVFPPEIVAVISGHHRYMEFL